MATKIHNSIQKQVKNSSLAKIASASNIFGRGFAEKRIQLILKAQPNILTTTQTIQTQEKAELITKIKSVEGLGEKTALQFVEALPLFQKFLEESNILKIIYFLSSKILHILFISILLRSGLFGK